MAFSQFPPAAAGGGAQLFSRKAVVTATGTFVHPDGASNANPKTVLVVAVAGGGGGGSGATFAMNTNFRPHVPGGGGGGPGGIFYGYMSCGDGLSVAIGAGGAGAVSTTRLASPTTARGLNGSIGGITSVSNGTELIFALGGGGGGSDIPVVNETRSAPGGAPGATNLAGNTATNGAQSNTVDSTLMGWTGTPSNNIIGYVSTGGAGGGAIGEISSLAANRTAGTILDTYGLNSLYLGLGGAGGEAFFATNTIVTSFPGANGTGYSGGGGGGGGVASISNVVATNLLTTGKGGDGGPGLVVIYY